MNQYKLIAISMDGETENQAYETVTKDCESLETAEMCLKEIGSFARERGIDMVYGVYHGNESKMISHGFVSRYGEVKAE